MVIHVYFSKCISNVRFEQKRSFAVDKQASGPSELFCPPSPPLKEGMYILQEVGSERWKSISVKDVSFLNLPLFQFQLVQTKSLVHCKNVDNGCMVEHDYESFRNISMNFYFEVSL